MKQQKEAEEEICTVRWAREGKT